MLHFLDGGPCFIALTRLAVETDQRQPISHFLRAFADRVAKGRFRLGRSPRRQQRTAQPPMRGRFVRPRLNALFRQMQSALVIAIGQRHGNGRTRQVHRSGRPAQVADTREQLLGVGHASLLIQQTDQLLQDCRLPRAQVDGACQLFGGQSRIALSLGNFGGQQVHGHPRRPQALQLAKQLRRLDEGVVLNVARFGQQSPRLCEPPQRTVGAFQRTQLLFVLERVGLIVQFGGEVQQLPADLDVVRIIFGKLDELFVARLTVLHLMKQRGHAFEDIRSFGFGDLVELGPQFVQGLVEFAAADEQLCVQPNDRPGIAVSFAQLFQGPIGLFDLTGLLIGEH